MRYVVSLAILVSYPINLMAAELRVNTLKIDEGWKFSIGDDKQWSDPTFDDAQWKSIFVGTTWEEQGHPGYDGYGWYRLHLRIPEDFQKNANLKRYQMLVLSLGKIDDVDQTWWNDKLIGHTGHMPDNYVTSWSTDRIYHVPANLIRWDADNVIAVRVFDGVSKGGMYEGPYRLRVASWRDLVNIKIDLGSDNGILTSKDKAPFSAEFINETDHALAGRVKWTIQSDEGEQLAVESHELSLPAQGNLSARCNFIPATPGFFRVKCALQRESNEEESTASLILGYQPEQIQTEHTRADDFDQFWEATLNDLAAVKPRFELTAQPDLATDTHDVFEVSMHSLGDVRVRGWYERPKTKGIYPALLRVPGYSEAMWPSGTADPIAVFSFNVRGHGNSQQDVSGTPEDFWTRGLDDKQGYYYQGAYADCVRAVDFLASRNEIDKSRIAITGGSQGGGLSLVTAGLDQRISLCAPDIPFLCNWDRYFKTSDWPEINSWVKAKPHRSWETMLHTLSYFDALNFADRIRCPVFLGLGLQDDVCPPVTIFAVYNKLSVPKDFRVYPEAGHWVGVEHHKLRRDWILKHFEIRAAD